MKDDPYASAAKSLASSFGAMSWQERSAWAFTRIRFLERIDADLRRGLDAFAHGKAPEETPLQALERMRRALDQLESEVRAIHEARAGR